MTWLAHVIRNPVHVSKFNTPGDGTTATSVELFLTILVLWLLQHPMTISTIGDHAKLYAVKAMWLTCLEFTRNWIPGLGAEKNVYSFPAEVEASEMILVLWYTLFFKQQWFSNYATHDNCEF